PKRENYQKHQSGFPELRGLLPCTIDFFCNGDSSEVRSRLDFERRRQLKSSTATVDERDSKGKNKEGEDANGDKYINRYLGDCSVKYVDGHEGSRSREFENQEVDATRGSIIRMEIKFVL